jgi:3-deoxy-D-manno-octulosonate 8-phosphate phosphatase (KDO 8-P phosphatase)
MFQLIQLFVYDFDGVLTDNTAYVDENGKETVRVHRGDGMAISLLKKAGYKQLILSTERNLVVTKRAEKLGISVIQGSTNKKEALEQYCTDHNILLENVLYVGNDINDFEVMQCIGIRVCPSDAVACIKEISDYVLSKKGGSGVIRELYDKISLE